MNRILIIEDNLTNMKLFSDLLEAKGYDVDKAYDGEEGYKKLEKDASRTSEPQGRSSYDLMILDIQLPKLNGFDLLEKAKNKGLKLPEIIIVSAFAMDNEINIAKLYNIKSYITKPVDVVKFMDTVDRAVKKEV